MQEYKNKDLKYTYGRNGTPTSESLIKAISSIYNADGCVLASSGMNAITTGLMSLIKSGDHILLPDSVYGSTRRFAKEEFPRLNIDYEFYFSCLVDRATSKIAFISSDQGGVDIEEVASKSPDKILTTKIEIKK